MGRVERQDLPVLLCRVTDLGLSYRDLEQIVCVPERTLREWSRGSGLATPVQLARLRELDEVAMLAKRVFKSADIARGWLEGPVPAFGDESPAATLRKGNAEAVIGVLAGFLTGAHT